MTYLEIETPDGTRRISLERDRLSIGRLSYNDVVLPYAQISRQHAALQLINGTWWITDLQSTNGLQINARRIQEHQLKDGDRVVLAPNISICFHDDNAAHVPPPLPAAPASDLKTPDWIERARRHLGGAPGGAPQGPAPLPPRPSSGIPTQGPPLPPGANGSWPERPRFEDDRGAPWLPGQEAIAGERPRFDGAPVMPPTPPGLPGGVPDLRDPFWRDPSENERHRVTSGPAGTLLHVCQTCGQLTAPDSVYCQNCHQPVARECPTCQLSLLPIQDICPRCHTPNAASVRRTRPGRTDV
jgi:hypothetical protein